MSRLSTYLRTRHDPFTSLVLVVPVFVVYHLGVLFIDLRNGVDLVSYFTAAILQEGELVYAGTMIGVALAILVAGAILRERGVLKPAALGPVLIESTVWAAGMVVLVGWATTRIFAFQTGHPPLGVLDKIVMAAGAGLHEELVFRVALYAGLGHLLLLRDKGNKEAPTWKAWGIAGLVSSVAFSAIHYVGPFADPFTAISFTFRALAGVYLASLYHVRGLAVAVYTHALYDLMVFFIL